MSGDGARILGEDFLREIVEGTAAETGEAFFDELVKHMALALRTKCAWVTEWLPSQNRLRALSFWVGDGYFGDFEYDIAGTPCEPVITGRRLFTVPERVIKLFKHDPSLEELGAVSYMGVPLTDTDGSILGHLAILDDAPMQEDPRALAIFNIFAGRAAAELRRLRRDRALVERERKLMRLIDGAMDAILELDPAQRVILANRAAERTLGCAASEITGRPFDDFLTSPSRGKLAYLVEDLRRPEGGPSCWIADGLEMHRADGATFPAEATLSRFEAGGRIHFTLILRNIDERLEAEESIRRLLSETAYLRAEIDALQGFDEILGESPALRALLSDIEKVAGTEATVLITGETGTGKELVAHAIHRRSARSSSPLIAVNCAAIASNLQESEFFGHERGAFTGATQAREGRFRLADGGTIFLDEVGEMSLDLQAKLLRVLQEGTFEPVGSSRSLRVDVRVIAATNRDLRARVAEGAFREDLLYRLNVFPLHVPPLRDRGDDVILIAEAFSRDLAARRGHAVAPLTPACRDRLRRYPWPGNIRELHNVIERALITSVDGRRLNLARALPDPQADDPETRPSVRPEEEGGILTVAQMQELERRNLLRALESAAWKISGTGGAAELLGMNPNTLASRMKALRIKRPDPSRG